MASFFTSHLVRVTPVFFGSKGKAGSCLRRSLCVPHTSQGFLEGSSKSCTVLEAPAIMNSEGYENAIKTLNKLQTNAAVLQKAKGQLDRAKDNVPATAKYLARVGITLDDLDKLSVIHVTGTKGKGSTCAFTERILRQHGYRTGLYTSPHLVAVTERIRLDGCPIQKSDYTKYFWQVYNALNSQKEHESDMPAYFKFLTVLAFKVFIEEGVDVAVIEVGIGGEYDCTNVIRQPVVCGITTLDYDHTSLLGSTFSSIAWHKSGIMKPGVPVFTVPGHTEEAVQVIQERANEKQCSLLVCPSLHKYGWHGRPMHLGLAGDVQLCNASLALQLAHQWMASHANPDSVHLSVDSTESTAFPREAQAFSLSEDEIIALREVYWPGRSQVIQYGTRCTVFLDGAHTCASISACVRWFSDLCNFHRQYRSKRSFKVLLFNTTGDRDPQTLLAKLIGCKFDLAIFTTNMASSARGSKDQTNFTVSENSQLLRCQRHLETWHYLEAKNLDKSHQYSFTTGEANNVTPSIDSTENCKNLLSSSELQGSFKQDKNIVSTKQASFDVTHMLQLTQLYQEQDREPDEYPSAVVIPYIADALNWINSTGQTDDCSLPPPPPDLVQATHVQVLVTGSLHLVGGVLGVIQPPHVQPMSRTLREQYIKACISTPGTP